MAEGRVGSGVLQVRFDRAQIAQAGKQDLLPSAQSLAADVAGVFAATKLIDIGKSGIEELKSAQLVNAQTTVILRNQGDQANITQRDIEELGQSMLNLAGFDDEVGKSAANTLERLDGFSSVEGLKRAETDAADLAVAMASASGGQVDLAGSADNLGKALAQPEKAGRLLRTTIGSLTVDQEAAIKKFEDMGDHAAAQNVILTAVEAKVSGVAKQYGDTLPGQIDKSTASWKEAKEQLVAGFAPAMELGAGVAKDLSDAIAGAPEPVKLLAGGVAVLGVTIGGVLRPASDLIRIYESWSNRGKAAAETSEALSAAQTVEAETTVAVDEAQLKRVVSNEQIAVSDAEVATAMKARQLAEYQALISNDALIVSEEELDAAMAATVLESETTGLALSSALGPIGLVAAGIGILVTALAFSGTAEHNAAVDTADYTQALQDQSGAIDVNVDKTTAHQLSLNTSARAAADAGVSYQAMFDIVRDGLPKTNEDLLITSDNAGTVADQLQKAGYGASAFGAEIIAGLRSGQISVTQFEALEVTLQGLHDKYLDNKAAADAQAAADRVAGRSATETGQDILDLAAAEDVATQSAKDLAAAQQTQNQEHQTRLGSVTNLFNAEQGLTAAEHSLAQAQRGVTDAERGVEDAERRVEDAQRSRTDAVERLTNAEEALKKAQQPADAETLGKAQLGLSDAHFRVADAQSAVTKAEKDAANARRDGKHSAAEVADLDRQVLEAKNSLQSAIFAETDAEKALQDVQAKGTDQDQAVVDAKKAVEDATKQVDDANRNVADSYRGVSDAQQRVVDAKDAVDSALLGTATATANLKDKQYELYTGTSNAEIATGNLRDALQGVADKLDPSNPLRKNIDEYIGDLAVLRDIFTLDSTVPTEDILNRHISSGQVGTRASGGRVEANRAYIVGERRPELFIPDTSGTILPDISGVSDATTTTSGGLTWHGDVYVSNPEPEPPSSSVGRELAILADKLALVG